MSYRQWRLDLRFFEEMRSLQRGSWITPVARRAGETRDYVMNAKGTVIVNALSI